MKVKAAKDGVVVRLMVGGNAVFVTSNPVEIDEKDVEAMAQVESMMKLGWLVEVKEEIKEEVKEEVKAKKGSGKKGSAKMKSREGGE
jgi:hypothetical protein